MTTRTQKSIYIIFVFISLSLCLYLLWVNLQNLIDVKQGRYSLLTQLTILTDTQATRYSIAFLIVFISLMVIGIYNIVKTKERKKVIIISTLIWTFALTEILTDYLLRATFP
jgi:hypothetical protein